MGPADGIADGEARTGRGGELWLAALVAVTALIDAVASVLHYMHFESGIDLAIFDQAVWHYSHFQAPYSSIKGEDLLGDHFHPIVALLAPLYWIWSDPRMLVIAQAVLVAASIVPVFLFARDRLGRTGAYLVGGAYAAFWGIQVGVLFDFHELAFAPLLIASAILFADREQWRRFWVAIALLLLVKEDMSMVVTFFGIMRLTQRDWRRGTLLVVAGIVWYELATKVLIPHFAGGEHYLYWTYGELGGTPLAALWALVRAPWRLVTIALSPSVKAGTLLALFAPFLFLSLSSRLAILAVPLLAERFLSTNPQLWTMSYHYSLPIAPVLAMAAAAGLASADRRLGGRRPAGRSVVVMGAALMLVANLAVTRLASDNSGLTLMTTPAGYRAGPFSDGADGALAAVPAGASVTTTASMLGHLSERDVADRIDPDNVNEVRYVLVNVLHIGCCSTGSTSATVAEAVDPVLAELTPVYYRDGWLLARRPIAGQRAGNGVLTPMAARPAHTVDVAYYDWKTTFVRTELAVQHCAVVLRRDVASGETCFRTGLAAYPRVERGLTAAIGAATPGLRGGCAQIAPDAVGASVGLARDLRRIAAAGTGGSLIAVADAYVALASAEANLDRAGLIERFVILCSPRVTGV